MRAASRTDPLAPTDTEMMTISLSDKPLGASVEDCGVLFWDASVGGCGVLVEGGVLLSLVDCEGSGVCCRISEVIPLPLPKLVIVGLSSVCEVAVGVGMVGWVEDWGDSGREVGMVGWVPSWVRRGEVGMVGWVPAWVGRGEVGMVGWVPSWVRRGEVGMVGWVPAWVGRGEVGMVGWAPAWVGREVSMVGWAPAWVGRGEVGMVGWVDDWGDSGREVRLGESRLSDASGEGIDVEFCALASDERVLNATAASSRTGNI